MIGVLKLALFGLSLFLGLFLVTPTQALEIPTGLDQSDLDEVASLLPLNTSNKLQSNPYPLGGYSGFEVGVAIESIDISDMAQLGDGPALEAAGTDFTQEINYPRIAVGKGLYSHLDMFLDFIPFNSELTKYGGLLRWCFYRAEFLPISMSLLAHGSFLNVSDHLNSFTSGVDLLMGINVDQFALYFGGGQLESHSEIASEFVASGTPLGSKDTAKWTLRETHSFLGIQVEFLPTFLAFQIDRYREPVYSAKLGIRY